MEITSSTIMHEIDASIRRTIVKGEEKTGIIFTSDRNTRGRSVTNIFEELAQLTVRELKINPNEIAWYERRISERTGDHMPQTPCFHQVTFGNSQTLTDPSWHPVEEDSFGARVAQKLRTPISEDQ